MKFWGVLMILGGVYVAFEWGIRGNSPWTNPSLAAILPGPSSASKSGGTSVTGPPFATGSGSGSGAAPGQKSGGPVPCGPGTNVACPGTTG